jgi:hypothetical protein
LEVVGVGKAGVGINPSNAAEPTLAADVADVADVAGAVAAVAALAPVTVGGGDAVRASKDVASAGSSADAADAGVAALASVASVAVATGGGPCQLRRLPEDDLNQRWSDSIAEVPNSLTVGC